MGRIENIEVAWIMSEIGDLLELKGETVFKVRAYRKAAKTIAHMTADLNTLTEENKLEEVPGIGKAIAAKIEELVKTGRIKYYDDLKADIPEGLLEILHIPGVGSKMAQELYKKLGVTSIDELEKAAKNRLIRTLPGMGGKTEQNILRGIGMLRNGVERTTLGIADSISGSFVAFLKSLPGVEHAGAAGSVRRMKDSIGDIDLVAGSESPRKVIEIFTRHPQVRNIISQGDTKASIVTMMGVQVDLLVVSPEQYWSALHHFTGSKEHNVRLREIAHKQGLKINEFGVFERDSEKLLPVAGEEDIYNHLGLPYIPPEIREDLGEIEAAEKNELPCLLELTDIKGDLHLHSDWSDGVNSIEQIVEKARDLGYQYIAITDHSKSLGIARGLSTEKLHEQGEYIRSLNKEYDDIEVISGIEADILSNGDLDYPDEILSERDVVIASVHSGFKQDSEKITGRIISAMKNKYVDVIAHPTGRLVARRDPYAVNIEEIFEAAVKYRTALEINASPDRLDLNDKYVRRAAELGIKICINTDAHETSRMEEMKYGVGTARRGWLGKDDVLNSMDYDQLVKYIKR